MSELLPEGINSLADCPYHLHDAIAKGLLFLSFFEELDEDERPPKKLWLQPDKMKEWFDGVKRMRKEKYGGGGDSGPGPIEDPVQNAAAKNLIVGD